MILKNSEEMKYLIHLNHTQDIYVGTSFEYEWGD